MGGMRGGGAMSNHIFKVGSTGWGIEGRGGNKF